MPVKTSSPTPDPRRSEINRRNRRKWRITPEGRARIGAAARIHRPWEGSTGPQTAEGKARSARNGALRHEGPSLRELEAEVAGVFALMSQMAATRRSLT
jgi:hypothetical protein